MKNNFLTVSQINNYIKGFIENDRVLANVWIKGEISNCKIHSSGHIYFSLKDDHSNIKAVMFKSRAWKLNFQPKNGIEVLAHGYISVYERDGQYQLYVDEMLPAGAGALFLALEELKSKLKAEGLFAQENKKQIPFLPRTVGIVSSPTGAALRDIVKVIKRRYPGMQLVLAPTLVQGEKAPVDIEKAIKELNRIDSIDVIIVARGGGSIEELMPFNTEVVARAIANSKTPIISAVGHETDFTLADLVADVRAATPSMAGELAVPVFENLNNDIKKLYDRLVKGINNKLATERLRTEMIKNRAILQKPERLWQQRRQYIDDLHFRIGQGYFRNYQTKKATFELLVGKLDSLSPLATLARGYSICRDQGGNVLKTSQGIKKGEMLEVVLADGKLDCCVKEVGDNNGRY